MMINADIDFETFEAHAAICEHREKKIVKVTFKKIDLARKRNILRGIDRDGKWHLDILSRKR